MKQSSKGDQAQSASPSKYRKLNGYTIQSSSTVRKRIRLLYAILFVIIWIGGTRSGRKSQQTTLSNDSRDNSDDNIAMDALNLLIEQGKLTKDDVFFAIQEAHSTKNKPVNHDICTNKCLWRMGTNGTWIQESPR